MLVQWQQRVIHFTQEAYAEEPEPKEVQLKVKIDWTPERIEKEIYTQAERYGVSAEDMKRVIQCESTGSTTIQSYYIRPDGTREQSFGLSQIHLPDWPEVTHEDAINPSFAINFMANKFSQGLQHLWMCY
jgi:hypothetical protein